MHVFVTAPASSERTRAQLGWHPTHLTLIEDLTHADHFTEAAYSVFAGSYHA